MERALNSLGFTSGKRDSLIERNLEKRVYSNRTGYNFSMRYTIFPIIPVNKRYE